MLTLERLRVEQGSFVLTANDTLQTGFVTVVGPSGSGKSTLLSAIAGFAPLANGQIGWNGEDISKHPPSKRPVSMLFQDNNLFPHLTIGQNVGLAIEPKVKLSASTREKVETVLNSVGLVGVSERKPAGLSGGQQSRAALARVLLGQRPIVLLDEPFSALGPGLRHEMLDLVKTVLNNKLVIMVTHDPSEAQRMGGQTIYVEDGVAEPAIATHELFAAPSEKLKNYLGN